MTVEALPATKPVSILRALVDLRERQIQKARIQFGNRLAAIERGADEPSKGQIGVVTRYYEALSNLEQKISDDIEAIVTRYPIYEELAAIKGIGPQLAAKMLAHIDIEQADTISALWRFAGYGVIDGKSERPVPGQKLAYCKRLKAVMYLVATSFLRCNSPYRKIYDQAKARYTEQRPEWTKLHIHRAATRKMIKVFLSHLWERWRELEGLATRPLYVSEYLQHNHVYRPEEFGWK